MPGLPFELDAHNSENGLEGALLMAGLPPTGPT